MMSPLIESYVALRHAVGFDFRAGAILLRSFARYATERGETHVRMQTAIDWATATRSLPQRARRLATIARFARHVHAEDERHEIPPTDLFGQHRRRPVPFIFTPAQLKALLAEARRLGPSGSSRPHTFATLFALLSATGLRVSEALGLRVDDVMADGLRIREAKFHKSRLVPLHESTQAALQQYLGHQRPPANDDHVFVSQRGRPLSYSTVHEVFGALARKVGLPRKARIHSLRHTFAVRALAASPSGRDQVAGHMVAVSTYLGHASIADTYWYFEATPPLLAEIAITSERFFKEDRYDSHCSPDHRLSPPALTRRAPGQCAHV